MGVIKVKRAQVLSNGCLNFTMKGLLDKTNLPFMKRSKKLLLKSKQTDQNKLKSKYSSNYKRNTFF
jgi:hypothetical protein